MVAELILALIVLIVWRKEKQEAHGPRVAHLSDIATADMQMCRKTDFQDGCHGGHLGYPIGTILATFDLQVTPMSPTKFGVNWPFGAGEEANIDFQDGGHSGHLGFLIRTILAIFDLQVTLMLPTKFRVK